MIHNVTTTSRGGAYTAKTSTSFQCLSEKPTPFCRPLPFLLCWGGETASSLTEETGKLPSIKYYPGKKIVCEAVNL